MSVKFYTNIDIDKSLNVSGYSFSKNTDQELVLSNDGTGIVAFSTDPGDFNSNKDHINQGINAIAIGNNAGYINQGINSIAIGYNAGVTNQNSGSIVINAGGTPLNTSESGLYINPIVSTTNASNVLVYNLGTKEICYSDKPLLDLTNGNTTFGSNNNNNPVSLTLSTLNGKWKINNGDGNLTFLNDYLTSLTLFQNGKVTTKNNILDDSSGNARINGKLFVSGLFQLSDKNLKEDIVLANLEECENVIKNLPLHRYQWKNNIPLVDNNNKNDRHELGWIAQEVQEVFPNSVIPCENYLTLSKDQIYASMYGALQSALLKIDSLKTRIDALELK